MHSFGVLILVGLIAFAFGERVARLFIASMLIAGAALFVYIFYRVHMGTI